MKRVFQTTVLLISISCLASAALACTCVADPLGTRYRKAKAVFIGQAVDPDADEPRLTLVQGDGEQTVAVIKSWKGIQKKYVSITFEKPKHFGACPFLFHLEPGKQYLVFAYGSKLEVRSVCSDTWVIPGDKDAVRYEQMHGFLKKLNSRRFRMRARLRLT